MHHALSFTGKRWQLASEGALPADARLGAWIAQRRRLPQDGEGLFDPSVFPDAGKAAARVHAAKEKGERVMVFGDYDCDGISSTAMLVRALQRLGIKGTAVLPHRERDGYGLKDWVIDKATAAGATLLLVADNGILSADSVTLGNARGIDTVILDHHHAPETPPPAYAILHPQLADFPGAHPSAAGVVFLFLHALHGGTWDGYEEDLSLAAMGTVADLVPLTGFNRMLVREGVAAMRRGGTGPVATLVRSCGCDAMLTSADIAYRIAPRINAAGRMDDPMIALRALLGNEDVGRLEGLNAERQKRTSDCMDALQKPADDGIARTPPAFIFHADAGYPPGIVGLLAGKLTEHWGRPSLVASVQGDLCTASLRSISAYHVTEALGRHAHLLTTFGGHAQAAGCTFPVTNLEALREALEADAAERLEPDALIPTLALEAELETTRIDLPTIKDLRSLEPFGQGNPDPLFLLRRVALDNIRTVGAEGRHLQATLGGRKLIGFGLGRFAQDAKDGVDLAFSLHVDTWNGRETPQLMVKDMRAAVQA